MYVLDDSNCVSVPAGAIMAGCGILGDVQSGGYPASVFW